MRNMPDAFLVYLLPNAESYHCNICQDSNFYGWGIDSHMESSHALIVKRVGTDKFEWPVRRRVLR